MPVLSCDKVHEIGDDATIQILLLCIQVYCIFYTTM